MPSLINADNGVVSGSVGLKYSTDNTGTLALQTNGNTAVTIDSSSRVGIGTTTPSNPLHIVNSGANINLLNLVGTNTYTSPSLGGEGPIRLQNTNTTNGNMSTISNYDGNGNINAQINFINMNHSGTADIAFTTRSGGSYPEKMRIDSAGRVTMPSQPAIFIALGTVQSVQSGANYKIQLDDAVLNRGSHWNTSTKRFTAPVSGVYYINLSAYIYGSGSADVNVYIYVNGSQTIRGFSYNPTNQSDANPGGAQLNATYYLNAGDYVEPYYSGGSTSLSIWNGGPYSTHLCVYLLG